MRDTLCIDKRSVKEFLAPSFPAAWAAFPVGGEPTSLLRGTANSHFSLSAPPDEVNASVEYAVATPAIPEDCEGLTGEEQGQSSWSPLQWSKQTLRGDSPRLLSIVCRVSRSIHSRLELEPTSEAEGSRDGGSGKSWGTSVVKGGRHRRPQWKEGPKAVNCKYCTASTAEKVGL